METRHKILLVDDDSDVLEMYQEMLGQLPSRPEICTASSASRAMAMLETEPYRLLISDLWMPKMDGLQLLSIVRRKYPQIRTVALTSVPDEQYRSRVYALGVDLFWQKPSTEQETRMFLECLESLLGQENEPGFRGVQSKSLVDIIQLECLSQSSSVLRITHGAHTAKIAILEGEIVDAEEAEVRGEDAFRKIMSWRTGSFETLPPEPNRTRTIFKPYNALLLESAQALDESRDVAQASGHSPTPPSRLAQLLSQVEGVEFLLAMPCGNGANGSAKCGPGPVSHGLENPERMCEWSRHTLESFRRLGELLHAGQLIQLEALGPQRNIVLAPRGENELCVGWQASLGLSDIRDKMQKVLSLWVS